MSTDSGDTDGPDSGLGKILSVQLVATAGLAAIVALWSLSDGEAGWWNNLLACLYGSALALAATLLAARSVRRAARVAGRSATMAMLPIYSGLLNKLVIVGGGIGFGLVFLGLDPMFVVTGYIVAQLAPAWLLARPVPGAAATDSARVDGRVKKIDAQNVT